MTEPSEEMKAMARRVADEVSPRANPKDVLEAALNGAAYRGALAAIIETQRADAELADEMRTKHSSPTGDEYSCGQWDQGVRIAAQIRTGNHYGKDESHD